MSWPTLFATAFRVFFLAAGLHAVAIISLWIAKLSGSTALPTTIPGTWWHSYEMVFGFARAGILGFLFTAGQNWCGKQLLSRASLALVFAAWLVGRTAWFLPMPLGIIVAAIDIMGSLFALTRLGPLLQPAQKHNHKVVHLFAMFVLAQVAAVAAFAWPQTQLPAQHVIHVSLLVVVAFIVIIAGRIMPFFTSLAVPDAKPRISQRLEKTIYPAVVGSVILYAAMPLHEVLQYAVAAVFLLLAMLNAVRWMFWNPPATMGRPILAILFFAYLWLIMGLLMLAAALASGATLSPAWHMLGIGAVALFILGMMTRVALGHTGRKIHAGIMVNTAYVLLHGALFARVGFVFAGMPVTAYQWSATLWLITFVVFSLVYSKILWQPRADGKPG